jgi:hypothetical protein
VIALGELRLPIPDAAVLVGSVGSGLDDAQHRGVLWEARARCFLLRVPGVARYLVEDGTTVTIDPVDGADPTEVERFLHTSPLAALYLQRGIPVLHAAVVAASDAAGVDVIVGDSARGKSTLAAILWSRGWSVLADDLVPLVLDGSGSPAIFSTSSDLVLWPDVIRRLQRMVGDRELSTEPCGPSDRRRRLTCGGTAHSDPLPIRRIWCLGEHNLNDIGVEEITGSQRFRALGSGAYNSRIAAALLDRAAYFGVAVAIAGAAISMRRLTRVRGEWTGDHLADLMEAHDAR